jgi:hypothetical protein
LSARSAATAVARRDTSLWLTASMSLGASRLTGVSPGRLAGPAGSQRIDGIACQPRHRRPPSGEVMPIGLRLKSG